MSEAKKKEPKPIPWLIPQSHGGALNSGGMPGNRGGRHTLKVVREIARDAYADRIPRLMAIIDNPDSKPSEVVAAMGLLEKTRVGQQHHVEVDQPHITLDVDALWAKVEAMLPRADDEEPSAPGQSSLPHRDPRRPRHSRRH